MTSSCIWIAIPADSVILYWYVYGADGRTGVRSRDYQNFSDYHIFLGMGYDRFELRYKTTWTDQYSICMEQTSFITFKCETHSGKNKICSVKVKNTPCTA